MSKNYIIKEGFLEETKDLEIEFKNNIKRLFREPEKEKIINLVPMIKNENARIFVYEVIIDEITCSKISLFAEENYIMRVSFLAKIYFKEKIYKFFCKNLEELSGCLKKVLIIKQAECLGVSTVEEDKKTEEIVKSLLSIESNQKTNNDNIRNINKNVSCLLQEARFSSKTLSEIKNSSHYQRENLIKNNENLEDETLEVAKKQNIKFNIEKNALEISYQKPLENVPEKINIKIVPNNIHFLPSKTKQVVKSNLHLLGLTSLRQDERKGLFFDIFYVNPEKTVKSLTNLIYEKKEIFNGDHNIFIGYNFVSTIYLSSDSGVTTNKHIILFRQDEDLEQFFSRINDSAFRVEIISKLREIEKQRNINAYNQ